jgi:hypothetical protein
MSLKDEINFAGILSNNLQNIANIYRESLVERKVYFLLYNDIEACLYILQIHNIDYLMLYNKVLTFVITPEYFLTAYENA